jgi:hypothetical protein
VRFVLANRLLAHAGGTETHLVTIGEQLLRLGHEVVLFSPELGPFAEHARRRGLDVAGPDELPRECDVVFAQDALVVYELAERYPAAFTVFRICGDVFDFQSPPQLEGLVDLVVVLSDRYARLARACAIGPRLLRLRIPVSDDRLVPTGPIRARPRRAVVLGNYADRIDVVRETWERRGIQVTQVGGARQRYDLAAALGGADIVVAKSRAALDAMACGRAVYVYDTFGGDGWVTPEAYSAFEADHFAGLATDRVIGAAELDEDLGAYRREMGVANRDLVLQHHRARDRVLALLDALAVPGVPRPAAPLHELARLTALQWSWESSARDAQRERAAAHERLIEAEQAAARAEGLADELREELAAIRGSRSWRLTEPYRSCRGRLSRRAARA